MGTHWIEVRFDVVLRVGGWSLIVALAACGRLGFDAHDMNGGAGDPDALGSGADGSGDAELQPGDWVVAPTAPQRRAI